MYPKMEKARHDWEKLIFTPAVSGAAKLFPVKKAN
jgi:hypothetical protein